MIKVEFITTKVKKPFKYKRFENFLRIYQKYIKHDDIRSDFVIKYRLEIYDEINENLIFNYPELAKAYLNNEVLNNIIKTILIFKDLNSYYNYREQNCVIESQLNLENAGFVIEGPKIIEIADIIESKIIEIH